MKSVTVILALAIIGGAFFAGWAVRGYSVAREQVEEVHRRAESDRLLDLGGARMPLWARPVPCRAPTQEEVQQDQMALQVLSIFDANGWSAMKLASVQHLVHPWSRNRSPPAIGRPDPCWPTELAPAIAAAALRAGVYSGRFLSEDSIALAEQLGPRDRQIVEAVGRIAFQDSVIPGDDHTDLRPFARLVLAEFGSAAEPWSDLAFAQMSGADEMGTGAAQVAVATGHAGALAKVQNLMQQILAMTPKDKPIPRLSRNRFYELAVALGMNVSAAGPFSDPVIEMLDRRVESWAPHFGMIDMPPIRLCAVAEHLGGTAAEAARARAFCSDPGTTLEQ